MGQLHFSDGKGQKHKLSDSINVGGVVITKESAMIIKISSSPPLFLKADSQDDADEWFKVLKQHSGFF